MKQFPVVVCVYSHGTLTTATQPQVMINPLGPTAGQLFRVDPTSQIPVGAQVADGVGLRPTEVGQPFDMVRLIYSIRAYLAVMDTLGCERSPGQRSVYEPIEPHRLTGDVNRENATLLCSLVHDVFGQVAGECQADLLWAISGKQPCGLTVGELPDPAYPDVIAVGPICDEGADKWRVVLRQNIKGKEEYTVHTQFFPESGANPYFENGQVFANYLHAVRGFAERVIEKARQQYDFNQAQVVVELDGPNYNKRTTTAGDY